MDTQTTTSITETTTSIGDEIAGILVAVIPALGPYAVPIDLGFALVANVAPPLYAEIKSMISQIQSGGTPSEADVQALRDIIASLKQPDSYFQTPPPAPKAEPITVYHPATL